MNGGRIPWNVTAICETYKIFCLVGKHLMRDGSEYHLTDQQYRLAQWSHITLFLRKTYREDINLVHKFCQVYSLDMRYTRRESGKETSWSQTLKNWSRWTSEIHGRILNAKEVLTIMKGNKFIFPVADGTVNNLWRRSTSENSHLNQGSSRTRRRTRNSSRRIRRTLFCNPTSR